MQRPESFGHQGAYRVVGQLGRGGFATVYKAYDERLDRYVAIKVLHAAVVQDERDIQRFQREARAAARLSAHPNIITIHDYGEQGGLAYLVLEYIEGGTLEERLAEPLSLTEADRIIGEIGAALDYAHSQSIVHRDIKPANVLLRRDGRAVLTDFGIARLLDDPGMSRAGFAGTAEYMAPEQFSEAPIDHRCDIYALGVVTYRLLTGSAPFHGKTWVTLAHKHLNEPPPPLDVAGRGVPAAVEAVVFRALAKDPADRPSSAGQFAADLTTALRPAVLLEQAHAALRLGELDRAERFAAEILVDDPDEVGARYVRQEALRRRQLSQAPDKVTEVLDLGSIQAASEEPRTEVWGQPAEPRVTDRPDPVSEQQLRRERDEHERAERERRDREREEQERAEGERAERERLEHERLAQERQERERGELERAERVRAERAAAERARLEREARSDDEPAASPFDSRTRFSRPPASRPARGATPESVPPVATAGDPAATPIVPLHVPSVPSAPEQSPARTASEPGSARAPGRSGLIAAVLAALVGGGVLAAWLLAPGAEPAPTAVPTVAQPPAPTVPLASAPTGASIAPTTAPAPTAPPTSPPTIQPTAQPTPAPTVAPTAIPTTVPTPVPTLAPTAVPVAQPGAAPAQPLPASLSGHVATLLGNGGLLVTGGREAENTLAAAVLYDPAYARWTDAGSMASPRSRHTATLLPTGKILVAGGRASSTAYPDGTELYDPATNAWGASGKLATARAGHTTTLLKDGRVLVIGGYDSNAFPLNTAELFDPTAGAWTATAKMAGAHSGHTATLLPDGQVLVVGGFGTQSQATAERYDPVTNTWTTVAPSATGRYDHTATLLPDGRVLVAGGLNSGQGGTYLASAEVYDPVANAWRPAAPMAGPRGGHTATLLPDGRVLMVGGLSSSQAGAQLATAEVYDPAANAWKSAGSLVGPRSGHTATLMPNGRVLVAGGGSGSDGPGLEQYDPSANAWTALR